MKAVNPKFKVLSLQDFLLLCTSMSKILASLSVRTSVRLLTVWIRSIQTSEGVLDSDFCTGED